MVDFILEVERREETGSRASRRSRQAGLLPSVVYTHGEESVPVLLSYRNFVYLAEQAGTSQVFTLKSKDGKLNGRSAIVKEIQKDFLKGKPIHVDFQALREDEDITVRVPLEIVGEAPGVKNEGGILTVSAHEVAVTCLPRFIPKIIKVDVSGLGMGQSIHAKALPLPEGVRLHGNPEETIVSVVAVRIVVEEAPTAAAVEGVPAEGEAAAPAEGEAPKEPEKGKEVKEKEKK